MPLSRIALVIAAAAALSATARAQQDWQAAPTPAIIQQPMHFANGNVNLTGTLYLPEHGDHLPAVIVFWGAGAPTREYALYQQLASGFPSLGVAVLLFDRRGSGESGGSPDATFQDLASDGIAALHALQHTPRIDPKRIGFWGLSQGGWLSVLAASKTPDAAFVISCSAPLVTPADQMTFAVRNIFTVRKYGDAALSRALALRQAQDQYLAGHGVSYAAIVDSTRKASGQPWFKDAFLGTVDEVPKQTPATEIIAVMHYDPVKPLEAVHVPTLIIYGGADPWVPVAASIERLKPIAAQKSNISYYVIAGADHSMSFPKEQTMAWDNASLEQDKAESSEYFLVMGSWLTRVLALR